MIHYIRKEDPRSTHQQILQIVKQLNQSPILDIGSAQGILGQGLVGSGLVVDAVEPDPQCAEAAKPFYRTVYNSTIEAADLGRSRYRVVVCGDVLEHVVDPTAALKHVRSAVDGVATFIISVPNIGHLSARLILLAGFFPKMSRGIFDQTHLHFFTRRTAVAMQARAGLKVLYIRAAPVPFELMLSSKLLGRLAGFIQRILIAIWPALFAYQWIFVTEGTSD